MDIATMTVGTVMGVRRERRLFKCPLFALFCVWKMRLQRSPLYKIHYSYAIVSLSLRVRRYAFAYSRE